MGEKAISLKSWNAPFLGLFIFWNIALFWSVVSDLTLAEAWSQFNWDKAGLGACPSNPSSMDSSCLQA